MSRTCIICLPRTGSQLCSKLISEVDQSYELGEYFEAWIGDEITLDENHFIRTRKKISFSKGFNINSLYQERLNFIEKLNEGQSLIIKLFLMDHYPEEILRKIILKLKECNFNFISLTRSPRNQLLSYMIAVSYQLNLNKNVFGINSKIEDTINIDIPKIEKITDLIYNSIINWNNNIEKYLKNVNYINIRYESIFEDLTKIYQRQFNYEGTKSISVDPLDLIVNKNDVLTLLKKYNI